MSTHLILLGCPQVEHDRVRYALPTERRGQLLALLALRRDWVARADLAALLWPGVRSELAATNLRKALHFARALPWAGSLESQPGLLRFTVSTDVHDIEAAHREGRIADALEHCRGALLDGMDDLSNPAWTDWLDAERGQHARRMHELTRQRLAQLESDPGAAAALALRLLEADPLDEDAVVALLAAQRELGRFDEQREAYRSFAQRLDHEFGIEPSLRVRKLLVASALPLDLQATAPATPGDGFFGRSREVEQLATLLARDACRLLTVLGPGGVGKSSLLKHALRRIEPLFADGVFWIALDDLHDTAQVAARVAAELRMVPGPQQQPRALIGQFLATRQALLVFDNAEHLDDLARFAWQLLADTKRLKICCSSRSRLAAPGEWLLPLGGLALPAAQAPAGELLASESARMFVACAQAMRPEFDTSGQAAAIGALVRATGGLPLAILLAAHWVRLLPVAEIVAELDRSLDVLDSDAEGEERAEHRSMRATIERSWSMLAPREQHALAALSVFVGSVSRQAALAVAGAPLPLLAALADKSLLQWTPDARCVLHPMIRQFALDKLGAERRARAQGRHADWFAGLLGRLGRSAMRGDLRPLDEIDADLENCRQAWHWAAAQGRTDQLAACAMVLMRFFELRGRSLEGLDLLQQAQATTCARTDPSPQGAAWLCASIAHLQIRMYRLEEAAVNARRGVAHARAAGARGALALCLNVLGLVHNSRGEYPQAKRYLEQAVRHARAANDVRTALAAQSNLAIVALQLGDHPLAEQSMLDVLAQERQLGNWLGVAILSNNLAGLYTARGSWSAARRCIDEGIAISQAHGIAVAQPHLFVNLAVVSCQLDDGEQAGRIGHQALAVARQFANRGAEAKALIILARLAARRQDCSAATDYLLQALACPPTLLNPPIQSDWLLALAQLRAAQGEASAAAGLLRRFLAQPGIEPPDRAEAESTLAKLPRQAAATPAPDVPLGALVRRLAAELAQAAAQPSLRDAEQRGTPAE